MQEKSNKKKKIGVVKGTVIGALMNFGNHGGVMTKELKEAYTGELLKKEKKTKDNNKT